MLSYLTSTVFLSLDAMHGQQDEVECALVPMDKIQRSFGYMAAIYSRFHRRDFKIGLFGHITGSPYNRIQIDVEIFEKWQYNRIAI